MNERSHTHRSCSQALVSILFFATTFAACSSDDDVGQGPNGGAGRAANGAGAQAGAASGGRPAAGGGGAGGSIPNAGAGGADAGTGSSEAGTGGSKAGTGGSKAGSGGSKAGSGGSKAGAGGSKAGAGGSKAGTGGAGGGVVASCSHDVCAEGGALLASCDACTAKVCALDGFCCGGKWDERCVVEAITNCALDCASGAAGGAACDAATCSDGCCDENGACVPTGTDAACGKWGRACLDCAKMGTVCSSGVSCASCVRRCDGKACGEPDGCGGLCEGPCAGTDICVVRDRFIAPGCYPCDATTCQGCCDASGACRGGEVRDQCGSQGVACEDCGDQGCNQTKKIQLVHGEARDVRTNTCGACGASCGAAQPGACVGDGCGGVCPGSACAGGGACVGRDDGSANCVAPGGCLPDNCDGCCYAESFFGPSVCVKGTADDRCGHDGTSCVSCAAKGLSCDASSRGCGSCQPSCDKPSSCGQSDGCGGICTGLSGGTCSASTSCNEQGACVCPNVGERVCGQNGPCQDLRSDVEHCGACNIRCAPGSTCENGLCLCPEGGYFCGGGGPEPGICTNLGTDPMNCGTCYKKCPGACVQGVCAQ